MMLPEFDSLYTLAEIAIGLTGFSAIVVLFRRQDSGKWKATHAHYFAGMVGHSLVAAFFCMFPAIVAVFSSSPSVIWSVSSAVLGIQVLSQTIIVAWLPTTSSAARAFILFTGLSTTVILALNVFDVRFSREFGPYLIGVLWHLIHAGTLFGALIWIPSASIEES